MNIRKKTGLEIYIDFSNLMDKTTFKDENKYKSLETDFKEIDEICNNLKDNFNKFKRLCDGDLEAAYEILEAENEKLEAENSKLKKERNELIDSYWKLQEVEKLVEKLKKENEELKRSNNTLKKLLQDLYKDLKNKKIIKQTIEIFTI